MVACIITGVVCLIIGAVLGIGIVALMVAAADDSREHEFNLEDNRTSPEETEGSDNGRC
ncbi:MAG: hypothetical protein ACOYKJ_04765 [Candidatus Howiella sp.]|jgi:hypothetical protein